MGLFHFPLNELAGWALNNMGTVILCLMLPTYIAALAFLPFLHPVPQTITGFLPSPLALSFLYSVAAFWWFYFFLLHFW